MTKPSKKTRPLVDYPFQSVEKIRYADTDRQGHVNNAIFSTFLECGRVEFLHDQNNPLADKNAAFVIVNLSLNFMAEILWPGQIEIGTGISHVGDSSFRLIQGLFQDGRCVATAESVIVQISEATRKPHPLTGKTRAFFVKHMLPTE